MPGVAAAILCCLALVALVEPASAAPKRISGTVTKSGYTVLAVAASGKATSVRIAGRKFRLRPPATRVTLHLRARSGRYAGPVVIASRRKGKQAIVGVKAGARLGRVKVGRGYARLARPPARKWVDAKRIARAKKGVPVGARVFGLVRARASGPAADRDLDGIPAPLDIDDDGDRILDNLERPAGARAAQFVPTSLGLTPTLTVPIQETTNASTGTLTAQLRDSVFARFARLSITIFPGDSAELDCGGRPDPGNPSGWIGGLRYCVRGGSGRAFRVPWPAAPFPKFPETSDPDGDGFGTLVPVSAGSPGMGLVEGTGAAEVRSGDVLIERVTVNGQETAYPATLQYVFGTVPAMASLGDETTSPPQTIGYPVPPGGPGTFGNGIPVDDGPDADGDVELTITFWRPQRLRTPGDPGRGEWIDIGGLTYKLGGFFGAGRNECPEALADQAADAPSDPLKTLTISVNLSRCLQGTSASFAPGDSLGLILRAYGANGADSAEQQFSVKRK